MDTIAGTAGRDKISGGVTALSSTDTLQATDQIDGGAGNDTLNLTLTKDFAGFTPNFGFLKNVETVNLTNGTTSVVAFAAKGVTGVNAYNVTGPASVTGMDSLSTKVNWSGVTSASTLVGGYSDTLTTGSSDSASIGVSGLGKAYTGTALTPFVSSTGTNNTFITLDVPGIETLNVQATGSNFVSFTAGNPAKDMVVTGSGSLTVGAVQTSLKTIDASALPGSVNLDLSAAGAMTSIKTGSGNDFIQVASATTADLRADAVVDGGAGTDILRLDLGTTALSGQFKLSGIETISLGGSTGALTFDASKSSGIQTIALEATSSASHAITGLGSSDVNVLLIANGGSTNTASGTVATTTTGVTNVSLSVPSSATTANFTTNGLSTDTVTANKSSVVNLAVPANGYFTGVLTATDATSVAISGAGRVNIGTNDLNIPKATSLTIDQDTQFVASGDAGDWEIDVDKDTATTAALTSLNVTAEGKVAVTGDLGNLESITVDSKNAFSITERVLTKVSSVTLSGSGNSAAVTLAPTTGSATLSLIGAADLAYGITINASGLKGGLTLGTADYGVAVGPNQAISIDISGLQSKSAGSEVATTIHQLTVGAVDTLTGSVNLNAKGMTSAGSLSVANDSGDVIRAKNITLDVSGSSPTSISLAAGGIYGDTVVIKANDIASTFNVGAINVKSSLDLQGSPLASTNGASTPVTINASSGSTALSLNLSSSIGVDEFTVTGVATNTTMTFTGGEFTSADTITVDASAVRGSGSGINVNMSAVTGSGNTVVTTSDRADTIVGGKGNDTITAGTGADTIDLSAGGDDTVVLVSPADTGTLGQIFSSAGVAANWSSSGTITKFTAGSYVSTSGFDKVIGFGAGDLIRSNSVPSGTDPADHTIIQTIGGEWGVGTTLEGAAVTSEGKDLFVRGTYDSSSNRFTFGESGADTLYLMDAEGSTFGGDLHGLVIVGYSLGADDGPSGATGLLGVTA